MTNPIHFTTPDEAVKVIKSGDHVHLSSVASAPQCLINAMCRRGEAGELKDVHIHHLHTEGASSRMSTSTTCTPKDRPPMRIRNSRAFFSSIRSSWGPMSVR